MEKTQTGFVSVTGRGTQGARLLVGGERQVHGELRKGFFVAPAVFDECRDQMSIVREEIFGPVMSVLEFDDEQEVVARANATEFGLASYFYSRDVGRVFRVAEALEFGMVGINTGLVSTAEAPFGGVKQSGLGREGGRQGIDEYVELKYLCLGDIA